MSRLVVTLLLLFATPRAADADGATAPRGRPDPESSVGLATAAAPTKPATSIRFGFLLNPLEPVISALVNKAVVISPTILIGNGRGACVISPQAIALLNTRIGGLGALIGFRVHSGRNYDGFYFGVRFGGGGGSESLKTFAGQLDAGWMWAWRRFRFALGVTAGGGYYAHRLDRGGLYLFAVDASIGFAL